jgi:plastocyanin
MIRTIGARALSASDRPRRALVVMVALIAVTAVASACGSSSNGGGASTPASAAANTASGGAPAASGSTVEINNFMFMPASLTVAVDTTVTWKFDDSTDHTVAADDKSFISPPLGKDKTYTHTFETAGTVKYHCSIHPFMTGTIIVK